MSAITTNRSSNNPLLILFGMAVLVNLLTINTAFFTDDPGLYGSIAKQLIYKHDFFQLYSYGNDWLDKPHMPFWLILCSFKLFGIHTWTYKLPALLCFLLSLCYTYLFTKKYYGELTALMAILIVSTSLHIIMSNADVRAEPYLMAFIIGSIYHLSNLEERFNFTGLVLGALLTAFAIMTKGIFVIIPIYGALGGQLLLQKQFREIFRLKWVALVILTVVFTLPEIYALYIQFDLHPEKVVFGKQHVSGIKWFLWDSQFGRFANDGPITRPSGSIFFFIHTLLWAFAPWCLLFYYAAFKRIRKIVKGDKQPEFYTLSGGLILLALFSISGFQLPFYTNIIFPLFAVVTADFCSRELSVKGERLFRSAVLWTYLIAFILIVCVLKWFLQGDVTLTIALVILLIAVVVRLTRLQQPTHIKLFIMCCSVMLFVGVFLFGKVYPLLIANKGQIKAAGFVNQSIPKDQPVYSLLDQNNIFQFYCDRPVKMLPFDKLASTNTEPNAVFFANQAEADYLHQHHISYTVIATWLDYPQENILPAFINFKTRSSTLAKVYLIRKNQFISYVHP